MTLLLPILSAGGWLLLALSHRLDGFALSAAFAILVAFPLTLRLDADEPRWLRFVAFVAGFGAVGSLLLSVGGLAAALAATWFSATLPTLAYGFVRFLSDPEPRRPHAWAEAASAVGPVVSAAALATSRLDGTFAGFPEPLATLTVTHFHFTFGLLPVVFSALARRGFAARLPLWGLIGLPPVIGLLMATRAAPLQPSPAEAAVAALLALTAAGWALGSLRPLGGLPAPARWAGRCAAVLFAAAMTLPSVFTLTYVLGAPKLDFSSMLRDHGLSVAIALTTLGLIAARYAPLRGVTLAPAANLSAPTRDIAVERAFFVDERVADLGPAGDGRFDRLADALLAYRFYPPHVMASTAAFKLEDRPARLGDRIGMCLLVKLLPGIPAARFPATTEVNLAERAPGHAAFGYLTTEAHYGAGAWSATLAEAAGRITLTLRSRMRPTHPLALLGLPLYRWFQKRAHAAGIAQLAALP